MAYTPTTWSDEVPDTTPVKYTIRDTNGNILYDNVRIDLKTGVTAGTAVNAANLNHIEQGIVTLENGTYPKVFSGKGQLMVGYSAGIGGLLGEGSLGQVLIADPSAYYGVRWGLPYVVAACYTRTTAQSFNSGAAAYVDYATKAFDTHNAVTTGASWKFTAPVSGYYQVCAAVCFAATTTWAPGDAAFIDILKNGSVIHRLMRQDQYPASNINMWLSGGALIFLDAGGYIGIQVTQSSGGALSLVADGTHNWVTIGKL